MKTDKLFLSLFLFLVVGYFTPTFAQEPADKDFDSFLKKFTTSAEFQYSRVRFPLTTPIFLVNDDGSEQEMPFTMDEWPLLSAEDLKARKQQTQDGVYFGHFTVKDADHVEFEAGLEESELDLSISFDLVDGKWYVTDCFSGWYGSVSPQDFDSTVYEVQQKNREFEQKNP